MEDTNLTSQQEAAIQALLAEPTVTAAASRAGCGRRTLHRWLTQPDFQDAYREARTAVYGNARARLQIESEAAVATLADLRDAPDVPASTRLSAAAKILDLAVQAYDLDEVEAYLAKLKAADDG